MGTEGIKRFNLRHDQHSYTLKYKIWPSREEVLSGQCYGGSGFDGGNDFEDIALFLLGNVQHGNYFYEIRSEESDLNDKQRLLLEAIVSLGNKLTSLRSSCKSIFEDK